MTSYHAAAARSAHHHRLAVDEFEYAVLGAGDHACAAAHAAREVHDGGLELCAMRPRPSRFLARADAAAHT